MAIEYVTMMKDYKKGKHRRFKEIMNILEEELICAVCVEKIPNNIINLRKNDFINTRKIWKLM